MSDETAKHYHPGAFTSDELREIAMEELGALMEMASERCHGAGWYTGLEDFLPDAVENAFELSQPVTEGRDYIRPGEAAHMLELVSIIGGWVTHDWEREKKEIGLTFYVIHNPN